MLLGDGGGHGSAPSLQARGRWGGISPAGWGGDPSSLPCGGLQLLRAGAPVSGAAGPAPDKVAVLLLGTETGAWGGAAPAQRVLVLELEALAAAGLHIFLFHEDQPCSARAWRELQKHGSIWGSCCHSVAQGNGRDTQPCRPRPSAAAGSLVSRGLPHPRVLALGRRALIRRAAGYEGAFIEELHLCHRVVAHPREALTCRGSPGTCRAPAPSPGAPQQLRSPCGRSPPACGIRGQIRRRLVLETQMSWIGKWGRGEEKDPAAPESPRAGGCRGRRGLRRVALGSSRGAPGSLGRPGVGEGHCGAGG